jgi:hypothetical protein
MIGLTMTTQTSRPDETQLHNRPAQAAELDNGTLYEAVQLDLDAHRARKAGQFDAAVGLSGLGEALRNGQLTRRELYGDTRRLRLFAGRSLDV